MGFMEGGLILTEFDDHFQRWLFTFGTFSSLCDGGWDTRRGGAHASGYGGWPCEVLGRRSVLDVLR